MRKTEFRAKRKTKTSENGKWIFGYLSHSDMIHYENPKAKKGKCSEELCHVDRNTIGQYTGLFDINKNKIFENDIIECTFEAKRLVGRFTVKWYDGGFCIPLSRTSIKNNAQLCNKLIKLTRARVIGNIYDNPEILNKGKTK